MTSKAGKDAMVAQFCEFTGAITSDASRLLKAHKYNLEMAMDAFYSDALAVRNAEKARNAVSPNLIPRLTTLFEKYAGGKGKTVIPIDGTLKWCEDLGVEPEDPVMLAVAELCAASEMGSFERKGWIDGWAKQKKDTIDGQKELLTTLRENMKNRPETYKKIYEFTFAYAKPPEQRSMPLDTAAPMWQLLIPLMPAAMFKEQSAWNTHTDPEGAEEWLERWIKFLTEDNKGRPISKDCWMQFLDFAAEMDDEFSAYDADAAWPSTMDAFVEHQKEHPPDKMQE